MHKKITYGDILNGKGPEIGSHHEGSDMVYMAHKVMKLNNINASDPSLKESSIFSGCGIHVNGYTTPPIEEIRRLVTIHGGHFDAYVVPSTSHIVCDNYTDAQVKQIFRREKDVHKYHVTVKWVLDSITARKKLSEADYVPSDLKNQYGGNIGKYMSTLKASTSVEANTGPVTTKPNIGLSTEENPNFLEDYFGNSRLHFIGMWRTRLPTLAMEWQKQKVAIPKNNAWLKDQRVVLHVDMDCFFVSALIRDDPHLCQCPVAVAHSSKAGSSEISSCNYPAREFGLKAGMFMSEALKKCPHLKVLPYNFPLYEEISREIYRILYRYGDVVEPVSVDEAYLEFSSILESEALAIGEMIRSEIYRQTRCCASTGIGPNMLLARIATSLAKPNGIKQIHWGEKDDILRNLDIDRLPGIGWTASEKLNSKGIKTCEQLWKYNLSTIQTWFGDQIGKNIFHVCRGIDDTALQPVQKRKSIGVDVNWGLRFSSVQNAEVFLEKLCFNLSSRLSEACRHGRTVSVKILKRHPNASVQPSKFLGHGMCENISKSCTLSRNISSGKDIFEQALPLFRQLLSFDVTDLRGLGVQLSKLVDMDINAIQRVDFFGSNTNLKSFFSSSEAKVNSIGEVQHLTAESEPFDALNGVMRDQLDCDSIKNIESLDCNNSSNTCKINDKTTFSELLFTDHRPRVVENLSEMFMNDNSSDEVKSLNLANQEPFSTSMVTNKSGDTTESTAKKRYRKPLQFNENGDLCTTGKVSSSSLAVERKSEISANSLRNEIIEISSQDSTDNLSTGSLESPLTVVHEKKDFSKSQWEFISNMPNELIEEVKYQIVNPNNTVQTSRLDSPRNEGSSNGIRSGDIASPRGRPPRPIPSGMKRAFDSNKAKELRDAKKSKHSDGRNGKDKSHQLDIATGFLWNQLDKDIRSLTRPSDVATSLKFFSERPINSGMSFSEDIVEYNLSCTNGDSVIELESTSSASSRQDHNKSEISLQEKYLRWLENAILCSTEISVQQIKDWIRICSGYYLVEDSLVSLETHQEDNNHFFPSNLHLVNNSDFKFWIRPIQDMIDRFEFDRIDMFLEVFEKEFLLVYQDDSEAQRLFQSIVNDVTDLVTTSTNLHYSYRG